jgi:FdhD protein
MDSLAEEVRDTDSVLTVPVCRFDNTGLYRDPQEEQDLLAVEEPVQIRVGNRDLSITMRTPGNDAELAAGFLFTEGFVQRATDIAGIECGVNNVTVSLTEGLGINLDGAGRNFYMTSSCGVCGKASIEALQNVGCEILPSGMPVVAESVIRSMPGKLRAAQAVFDRTGGLHASGLFSVEGDLILVREDVGRHNALDKLIGRALLDGRLPLHQSLLLVSGRTSFELLQKAVMAGIPLIAAVGAPSSLAVTTAVRFGVTLIGFVRDDRFNVYSGVNRINGRE